MPIYEYKCEKDHVFEVQQSISENPLEECKICREENNVSTPVKKLISASTFHLQGGGWARDNYSK